MWWQGGRSSPAIPAAKTPTSSAMACIFWRQISLLHMCYSWCSIYDVCGYLCEYLCEYVCVCVNMFEVLEAGLRSTKITHQFRTDADRILEVETLRHDSSCVRFEWLEGFVYGFPLTFRTFQWCSRILTLAVVCCIMLISLFITPRFVLVAVPWYSVIDGFEA